MRARGGIAAAAIHRGMIARGVVELATGHCRMVAAGRFVTTTAHHAGISCGHIVGTPANNRIVGGCLIMLSTEEFIEAPIMPIVLMLKSPPPINEFAAPGWMVFKARTIEHRLSVNLQRAGKIGIGRQTGGG